MGRAEQQNIQVQQTLDRDNTFAALSVHGCAASRSGGASCRSGPPRIIPKACHQSPEDVARPRRRRHVLRVARPDIFPPAFKSPPFFFARTTRAAKIAFPRFATRAIPGRLGGPSRLLLLHLLHLLESFLHSPSHPSRGRGIGGRARGGALASSGGDTFERAFSPRFSPALARGGRGTKKRPAPRDHTAARCGAD